MKDWQFGLMFVGMLGGFATMYFAETHPTPGRCWKVPEVVPRNMTLEVRDREPMTVCGLSRDAMGGDALQPQCWAMVERRGKECEKK